MENEINININIINKKPLANHIDGCHFVPLASARSVCLFIPSWAYAHARMFHSSVRPACCWNNLNPLPTK